jgi:hypothetical protein
MKKTIIVALLACTSAHAEFRTGNKLLDDLNGSTFTQGLALGYIMGVVDTSAGTNHCPPSTLTGGQAQDMVKNFLVNTPAIRHMPAPTIIEYLFNQTWPCKKGSSL